jgi:23S rRNA (guanosine2251-2'-O)-methyltransferase
MNLICGVNPVLEALAAGKRHFDRLLIVKGLSGRRLSEAIRRATRLGIPLRFEMRETLDRLAAGVPHQGIIAVVSEMPLLSLEALLDAARPPALLVALDGVEDPRNLGAILRSVEAAGADGVLLPERHSAGLSETVARASAGAIEHVRVARVGNLVQALEELKARGIWVVGLDAAGKERWDAVELNRPVVLVLGGEGRGMRRLVREHCDHLVSIPHFGHVSSLNVSVAAGIALYEAVRQRKAVPSLVRPIPQAPVPSQVIGPGPGDDGDEAGISDPRVEPLAEPDAESEDELETGVVALSDLDFHDDVAWARGPTVLKPIEFRRARRPGRRGKPPRRRPPSTARADASVPRTAGPPGPTQTPSAAGPPEDAARGERGAPSHGRHRRRRRKRSGAAFGGDGPAGEGEKPTAREDERTSAVRQPGADADAPASEPGGEDGPSRHHRRRRRRRR